MSEIAKRIDAIIREELAAALKKRSFRKRGRSFHRHVADNTQVVHVQASRSNLGADGKFTVNLGIYYPAVAELMRQEAQNQDQPREVDCARRMRIGILLPTRNDHWWQVGGGASDTKTAVELRDAVVTYGIPWLDQYSCLQLRDSSDLGSRYISPIVEAAALVVMGRRDDAVGLMRESMISRPRTLGGWAVFARRAGLTAEYARSREELDRKES